MQKTRIEWVKNPDGSQGWTLNPFTGCHNHTNGLCKGGGFPCYAYRLAHGRLKSRYLANENVADNEIMTFPRHIECIADPFYPRFWPERLAEIQRGIDDYDYQTYIKQKPRGIFICDMSDLFGIGIPEEWTAKVLEAIADDCNSFHRFYLLTKQPQNLARWSPFPDNCWVGVTATDHNMLQRATGHLRRIKATIKYISLEPLLKWQEQNDKWLIEDWQAACINGHTLIIVN